MIANAMLLALAVLLGCLFYLMGELKFLAPYKTAYLSSLRHMIFAWFGILFLNLFAAVYRIERKFFLKDTGRKLWHIDNQANGGHSPCPWTNGDWNGR